MRLLLVNVNTTESMTATIVEQARAVASAGTEITGATPWFGPSSVETPFECYLSAVGVLDCAYREAPGHDAVIVAGFGDPGRDALQDLLQMPVFDITDAALAVAAVLGRTFAVVTTLASTVAAIEDRVLLAGMRERCVGVRVSGVPVLGLDAGGE